MSEAKNTPGPWTAARPNGCAYHVIVGQSGKEVVGEFRGYSGYNAPNDANAQLIAAAPEMLRALEDAAEVLQAARARFPKSIRNKETFDLENVLANSVNRAIRKAKGLK